jgi:hypothetical protein
VESCEQGNKLLYSEKGGEFLDQFNDYIFAEGLRTLEFFDLELLLPGTLN